MSDSQSAKSAVSLASLVAAGLAAAIPLTAPAKAQDLQEGLAYPDPWKKASIFTPDDKSLPTVKEPSTVLQTTPTGPSRSQKASPPSTEPGLLEQEPGSMPSQDIAPPGQAPATPRR